MGLTKQQIKNSVLNYMKNSQVCIMQYSNKCKEEKGLLPLKDFYSATNTNFFANGKLPICKECMREYIYDKKGNIDYYRFKKILEIMNYPYFERELESAINEDKDTLGVYFRSVYLNHKGKSWEDGEFPANIKESEEKNADNEFILRWGNNWTENDYTRLEKFYCDMKRANKIETPQDEDYLKKLARLSVKIDRAIENDETGKAKQLGDLYSKYMTDSKFRAMDMTDADKQGGIRSFSQIYAEVEKDDFIPPWQKYMKIKGLTQDIIDKTIMHIENFTLKLNKVEKMTEPPCDTPKAMPNEIDDSLVDN